MLNHKIPRKWLIAICVTSLLASVATGQSLPTSSQNVNNTGFIYTVGVGVFTDQSCTLNVTKVDWGSIVPGGSVTKTAYIKNGGSANVQLSMVENNLVPASIQNYISLSWNATNYVLAPGEIVPVLFVLNISPNVPVIQGGIFGFNIIVTGQGT